MVEPQKYQWALIVATETDGEDLQGGEDVAPDTLDACLKDWAARMVKLTASCVKNSLHGKVVTIQPASVRMESFDTEDGVSSWKGQLWVTLLEG